jgi:hypothetical protein
VLEVNMKSFKGVMILTAALLLLLVVSFIVFYGHLTVLVFARSTGIDISYKQLITAGLTEFVFKDLSAVERQRGIGLSSSGASIKIVFDGLYIPNAAADFSLNDVQFIKRRSEEKASYNSIDGLIALPFDSQWKYKTISGKVSAIKDGIRVRDFVASGDSIRFSFDGTLTGNNIIKGDITMYFEREITGKMPPELAGMALKDAGDGWKSLTLKVEGDLAKPAIQVTGRLFRLNIGVKPL